MAIAQRPPDGANEPMKRALSYRWIIWSIMILAFMVSFFHRLATGVVKEALSADFTLSAAAFGNMASMYFYAYMIMQTPVGLLADTLGPRATVTSGMLVAGAGALLFGLAPSVIWLFVGRFLVGIGVATVFVCIMKIQSQWFREGEFATLSGATSLLGNLGGILSQGPLALLLTVISWRSGFVGIGAFTLLLSGLCWFFIRNRPQDMGLPPINERAMLRASADPADTPPVLQGVKAVFGSKGMAATALFYFFNQAALYALLSTWGIPWLTNAYGFSLPSASSYAVLLILGVMVAGPLLGWLSDRHCRRKYLMIALSAFHLALWVLLLLLGPGGIPPGVWLGLFLFLTGVTSTTFVLAWSVAKDINSERFTGLAISVVNTAGFLGTALCTSFIGVLIDRFTALPPPQAYHNALVLPAGAALLALFCACFLPEAGGGRSKESGR